MRRMSAAEARSSTVEVYVVHSTIQLFERIIRSSRTCSDQATMTFEKSPT
jgi:hypothetical protein